MRRRLLLVVAMLVAGAAGLIVIAGGSASLPPLTTATSACPPDQGRLYCVSISTYNGLARQGGVQVNLKIENRDNSTLTHPAITLSWSPNAALTFASGPSASNCNGGTAAGAKIVTCSFGNLPAFTAGNPPSATATLYFTANAASSVSGIDFTADGAVKESGNDSAGAANEEHRTVSQTMTFGDAGTSNVGTTVALPDTNVQIGTTSIGNASVKFKGGNSPFLGQIVADSGNGCAFFNVACTGLGLTTDLSGAPAGTFGGTNPILWQATVNSTTTNIVAVHRYDPVAVTATSPKTFTAAKSFASCDGVTISNPPAGLAAGDYWVINATTNAPFTFQVASASNGKALTFTGSGVANGSCIRIIGDQKTEKFTSTSTPSCTDAPGQTPALFVKKLTSSTVLACLWDDSNGRIGW